MAAFADVLKALAGYGNGELLEAQGYAALSASARERLHDRLVADGLRAGYAVAGNLVEGSLDVIGDRSSGWPDVRLERADDGRLAVFVLAGEGSTRSAVHVVVRALEGSGLTLVPAP